MKPWADKFYTTNTYSMASLRVCSICGHTETYHYTGGHRGAGFVGGNKANGRMVQHIKAAHSELSPREQWNWPKS